MYAPASSFLKIYVDKIIELHEDYFRQNEDVLKLFKIFSPKSWKRRMPRDEAKHVKELATLLKVPLDLVDIEQEWTDFREMLVDSELFCQSKGDLMVKPEEFWTHVLNSKKFYVPIVIREMLEKIMTSPLGSR